MNTTRRDTDTFCHCGAAYKGSDHCPDCFCEQYESSDCGNTHVPTVTVKFVPRYMSSDECSFETFYTEMPTADVQAKAQEWADGECFSVSAVDLNDDVVATADPS